MIPLVAASEQGIAQPWSGSSVTVLHRPASGRRVVGYGSAGRSSLELESLSGTRRQGG